MGIIGRPKAQIPRSKAITVRLTNFEQEKFSRLAEKFKISKTETVVRTINLLEMHKPKKYKSFAKSKTKNDFGTVYGNSDDDSNFSTVSCQDTTN